MARQLVQAASLERTAAYAAFDRGDLEIGEKQWAASQRSSRVARDEYTDASSDLDTALLLDTSRSDVRDELVQIATERIDLAASEHRSEESAALTERLGFYNRSRRVSPTARVSVTTSVPATVSLVRDGVEWSVHDALDPGSYTLLVHADGHAPVVQPFVLGAGESRELSIELPLASKVPDGFIYIPEGSALYGSRDDEAQRNFFGAAPMHDVSTRGFLIKRTETTYGEWIEFLEALDGSERAKRTPHIDVSATVQLGGVLELAHTAAGWELTFAPANTTYHARAGEPIVYSARTKRAKQDWLRMPVSGITPADAEAYTAWLAHTGKVPHARLCTEVEWEHAARGADGRSYPHGEHLLPDDANIDVTYGQKDGGFGMDEVGSHPASRSPFGLLDTSGNVWEITRAIGGTNFVMRGGGFYTDAKTAHLANRSVITSTFKHLHVGLRVCADAP